MFCRFGSVTTLCVLSTPIIMVLGCTSAPIGGNDDNENTNDIEMDTFTLTQRLSDPEGPIASVVIADLNQDGRDDVIAGDNGLLVFNGDGDGGFGDAVRFSVTTDDLDLTTDLDGDGDIDLVTPFNLIFNTSGTMVEERGPVDSYGGGFAIADFNGDNFVDYAYTNCERTTVFILCNLGDGSFGSTCIAGDFLTGGEALFAMHGAHLDDSSPAALLVVYFDPNVSTASAKQLHVLRDLDNDQPPTEPTILTGTEHFAAKPLTADADGDGRIDIIWVDTHGMARIYFQSEDGSFDPPQDYQFFDASGAESSWIGGYGAVAADLDVDGDVDIATLALDPDYEGQMGVPTERVLLLELVNLSQREFGQRRESTISIGPIIEVLSQIDMHTTDMDGDGDLDIICQSLSRSEVLVLENTAVR